MAKSIVNVGIREDQKQVAAALIQEDDSFSSINEIVQEAMDKFTKLTGREYHLFNYIGAPDAERVIIIMGSGAETAGETAQYLSDRGEKVGVLKVHLYRPFSIKHFIHTLPPSTKTIASLDLNITQFPEWE